MSLSDLELIKHIRDEVSFVLRVTHNKTEEEVVDDEILCRAVVRSIEIIGEAAKKIHPDFKAEHAHIEWRKLAGIMDKLIHHYFGVDYEIVWDVIVNKLPDLQHFIDQILK